MKGIARTKTHWELKYNNELGNDVMQGFKSESRAKAWCVHIGRPDLVGKIKKIDAW